MTRNFPALSGQTALLRALRLVIIAVVLLTVPARPIQAAQAIPADLPCDNWPLHTRTLPDICPEVLWSGQPAQGLPTLWSLAFDAENNLYFTRPALGEIWRLAYRPDGRFATPQRFESGFTPVHDALWALGLLHPELRRSSPLAWVARDAAEPILWRLDGASGLRSGAGRTVALTGAANPSSLAWYQGPAFPGLRGHLLVTTAGSWNSTTIDGYELVAIPIGPDGAPGQPYTLIPANVGERSSSDASLTELTFFPDHPVALAVDRNGWIYIGLREGMIVRLRPRPAS